MDNNKDYTDSVSLGQLDTLMLLIYGYKKAEVRLGSYFPTPLATTAAIEEV